MSVVASTPASDGALTVVVDDLAFVSVPAVARPVDANLRATTALLRRLELAGGAALAGQLRLTEPLGVGAAVVTGAGDLAAELLVHAVVSSDEERVTRAGVRRALASALQRAGDFGVDHLALPPFGLGAGNLAIEESADVMLGVIRDHLASGRAPRRVTVVVERDEEADAFTVHLSKGA